MNRTARVSVKLMLIFLIVMLLLTGFQRVTRTLTLPYVRVSRLKGASIVEGEKRKICDNTLPVSALVKDGDRDVVCLVEEKDTVLGTSYVVREVPVRITLQDGINAEVSGDVSPQSAIVIRTNKELSDTDEVLLDESEQGEPVHLMVTKEASFDVIQMKEIGCNESDYCLYRECEAGKVKELSSISGYILRGNPELMSVKVKQGKLPQNETECILDSSTCEKAFGKNGIGQTLNSQGVNYTIVGTFVNKGPLWIAFDGKESAMYTKLLVRKEPSYLVSKLGEQVILDWESERFYTQYVPTRWSNGKQVLKGLEHLRTAWKSYHKLCTSTFERDFTKTVRQKAILALIGTILGLLVVFYGIYKILRCGIHKRVVK